MTTFAEPPPSSSSSDDDNCQSVSEIINTHFNTYQRCDTKKNVSRTAEALHHHVLSFVLSTKNSNGSMTEEQVSKEVAAAVTRCMDGAMSIIAASKKKDSWAESVTSILELAAAYATTGKDQLVARAVINRAIEYLLVEKDTIRMESCTMLGWCVGYLVESCKPAVSILKKKGKHNGGGAANTNNNTKRTNDATAGWKLECLIDIGKALQPRLTDKIAKVRNAAISACVPLFFSDGATTVVVDTTTADSKNFEVIITSIQNTLLWIMANDTSAPNRALVAKQCCGLVSKETIPYVIERVKDVDVKVREAALDSLRENVNLDDLTEDQRVEILRYGLTKRCSSTHAKAVELLCANWLKSAKFDPIVLLDSLNPVLNESVCELATEVIINMASKIDCDNSDDVGVELVQKHFGGPEIRSFQQQILKKRSVTQNDDEGGLSPSLAFFLRVKCNTATNKVETISDVINDIPTLCNLLNSHVDKLIEFNKEEDDDEGMDEDERDAYEDAQNFICLQLIHMANSSELQEEGSRRHFISIMRSMLSRLATPDDLVDACVKTMALAHDTESHFLQTISEILVDIEDDNSTDHDEKAIVVVRQMRTISILSFVLENIGGKMVGNPILASTLQHLLPAVTSKNAVIREHGVICLSKFCLLSEEDKIMDEFKPLLMQIAGSVEERVEVRAQAMLALCDLTLLHKDMLQLSDEGGNNESTTFKELLLEMLGHPKQGIAVIAAEVAAKLLLAGCLHDPTIIAWLLVIYFDASLTEVEDDDDVDGSEVKKVGSPVRLQQLLSIFFPTYSMSSLDANDAIMAAVGPLLTIVNGKLEGKKQAKALNQWPIAKMVEYICYNVDLADKKKKEESADETDQAEVDDGSQVKEEGEGDNQAEATAEDDDTVVEASSTLLASIDIAEFLSEEGASAPTYYNRALAKMLGSASIDVDAEDTALLSRLKSQVAEAEYSTDDGPTVNQIKKLLTLLADVADFEEDERSYSSEDTSGEPEEEEEEQEEELDAKSVATDKEDVSGDESFTTATFEENIEKENVRLSMSSMKSARLSMGSMKSAIEHESEVEETPSKRVSLGAVN
mmetsp:Transcript_25068/g.37242  ORF Transcript_25068/g.37242 Transcript_25068/m.37242 type:complete len:1078 (-) Transcript_25068:101-3334(-)